MRGHPQGTRQALDKAVRLGQQSVAARIANSDDADRLVKLLMEADTQQKNYVIRRDESYLKVHQEQIDALFAVADALKGRFTEQANLEKIGAVIAAVRDYDKSFRDFVTLMGEQTADEQQMMAAAGQLEEHAGQLQAAQKSQMTTAASRANLLTAVFSIGGGLVGLLMAFFIPRIIVRPIRRCLESVAALAGQDFGKKCSVDSARRDRPDGRGDQPVDRRHRQGIHDVKEAAAREKQAQAEKSQAERRQAEEERRLEAEAGRAGTATGRGGTQAARGRGRQATASGRKTNAAQPRRSATKSTSCWKSSTPPPRAT